MSLEEKTGSCGQIVLGSSASDSEKKLGGGDSLVMQALTSKKCSHATVNTASSEAFHSSPIDTKLEESSYVKMGPFARSSLRHMHDLYETVAEITVEPTSKDEPDVKAFFKVLRNHKLQSKFVYVLTVVMIVFVSHSVLAVRWLLPYYYSITTPVLLFARLIMYWKMKYQYFMLDFCYFANTYWLVYIWVAPEREDVFAVGFAVANGPLIWALLVFRNSLVFHSLDKVTSLYIHLLPSLMSYVIRWYPDETSEHWIKPFTHTQLKFNFCWLVFVPFSFVVLHQTLYILLVNIILRPSEEYLNLYRYVISKETTIMFRMCNILGPRYRVHMYVMWCLSIALIMLLFNPIWYNFFIPHFVVIIVFIIIAIFNGATYYLDVFSLEAIDKNRASKTEGEQVLPPETNTNNVSMGYGTVVICTQNGDKLTTKAVH